MSAERDILGQSAMPAGTRRMICPNCGRAFNCDGTDTCWCLKIGRDFDYEAMILRTGMAGCVCPVCLTGRGELAGVGRDAPPSGRPAPRRRGRRRQPDRPIRTRRIDLDQ